MKSLFSYSFIFLILITIIVSVFCSVPDNELYGIDEDDIYISKEGYTWPIPNKYYISSYFGYRDLQIAGSGPFHSGIDVPAETGTFLLAITSGTITYTGFSGSGRLYYNYGKW